VKKWERKKSEKSEKSEKMKKSEKKQEKNRLVFRFALFRFKAKITKS
jgi:hypothetical protein